MNIDVFFSQQRFHQFCISHFFAFDDEIDTNSFTILLIEILFFDGFCDILMVLYMKNIPHSFAFIGHTCLFCLSSYSTLLFTIIFLMWIYIFSLWLAMWWSILIAYNVFDEMPQWSIWLIFNWFLFVRIRKSRPREISWLWVDALRKREWKMKCEILNFDDV